MMKSGGGSIAFCSSAIAHRGFANHDALAAAKGAVSDVLYHYIAVPGTYSEVMSVAR